MKNKGSILIPILIVGVIVSVILGLLYVDNSRNRQGDDQTPSNTPTIVVSPTPMNGLSPTPTSKPTQTPTPTPTGSPSEQTISGQGFIFRILDSWRLKRNETSSFGLIPKELYNQGYTTMEILTIFTAESNNTPREWSIDYNGFGYSNEREVVINGYSAFYSVYERDSFTDIKYVISNGSRIVASTFRKLRNYEPVLDNSKYESSMEEIVNSIQFTD